MTTHCSLCALGIAILLFTTDVISKWVEGELPKNIEPFTEPFTLYTQRIYGTFHAIEVRFLNLVIGDLFLKESPQWRIDSLEPEVALALRTIVLMFTKIPPFPSDQC